MRAVLEAQRLDADPTEVARTFERAWLRVSPWDWSDDDEPNRALMLDGPVPEWISTREAWRRQFDLTFEAHGLEGDPIAGAAHFVAALSRAPAYPDAHATVEALAAAGYRLGLLSNADEDFLQSAISTNRLRFSVIQSSESLRVYKPHRAAFEELVHRLGCRPDQVLYVGDSPHADVSGARNAGLPVALVRRVPDAEYPQHVPAPDLQLHELAELPGLLPTAVEVGS